MGTVALDLSISLDGFVAGTDPGLRGRFGDGGEALHAWAGGARTAQDEELMAANARNTGAILIGRRTFDFVRTAHWRDEFGYGAVNPPLLVLTSGAPPHADGFTFVTGGLEHALSRAQEFAADKDVVIMGGANLGRQCLAAGLLDELRLHLTPILLGTGTALFTKDIGPIGLVQADVVATKAATHITYRLG